MIKSKRPILYYYIPTKRWLQLRRPRTKKEIIAWYRRSKSELEKRLLGPVTTEIETTACIVGKETKKVLKAKTPKITKIEKWRLTKQDYLLYKEALNLKYERLKREYNERQQRIREDERDDAGDG